MAKQDKKIMQYRIDGMMYAYDVVKNKGIEELEKDLKWRRAKFVPLEISAEQIKEALDEICTRVYNSTQVAIYKVLHDIFGFGKRRLKRFERGFNETCKDLQTLDAYGERMYCFEDYAEEYNEKYELDIDMSVVKTLDGLTESDMENHKRADVNEIKKLLADHGYQDAAGFLESYLG